MKRRRSEWPGGPFDGRRKGGRRRKTTLSRRTDAREGRTHTLSNASALTDGPGLDGPFGRFRAYADAAHSEGSRTHESGRRSPHQRHSRAGEEGRVHTL